MTKRKTIASLAQRRREIEELCRQSENFSGKELSAEEKARLHGELDILLDEEMLPQNLVPAAKKIRCALKTQLELAQ